MRGAGSALTRHAALVDRMPVVAGIGAEPLLTSVVLGSYCSEIAAAGCA